MLELLAVDFGISSTPQLGSIVLQRQIETKVNELVGAPQMKTYFADIRAQADFVRAGGNMTILHTSLHTVSFAIALGGHTVTLFARQFYLHSRVDL